MLVDGIWWEYEARTIYPNLGAGYNYGERDFRYLLLPALENQAFAANKTVFASGESGTILVPQDKDQERLAMSKEFVKYLLKDENLIHFTRVTGATTAYDYEMSEELLAELTQFTRNAFELINDTENIVVVRPQVSELISPLSFASNLGTDFKYKTRIDGIPTRTIHAFREYSFNKIWESSVKLYSEYQWNQFINQAKNAGFLND